jgi:protein-arginine kinase activator protein McsA
MDTGVTPSGVSDLDTLKAMLENALAEENYEMAQKIQDILKMSHKSEEI